MLAPQPELRSARGHRVVRDWTSEMRMHYSPSIVLTVGHSTRSLGEFILLLAAHSVTQLIDVRTVPRSRRNPQFNRDTLGLALESTGMRYEHAAGLGGFRRTRPGSQNMGWRNASFRGFADYMQTAQFEESLADLIERTTRERIVLMCAEAVPWRCHRSLIADALVVHGICAMEIVNRTRLQTHTLTPFAKVDGSLITYPQKESPPEQLSKTLVQKNHHDS